MMKNILLILVGFILGTSISTAYAKYEASNNDAAPVIAYGYNGTSLVPWKVDTDGILQTN